MSWILLDLEKSLRMNNYWKYRFLELEKASHRLGFETYKKIEDAFDEAQREIEKEIESWYGRFAKNNNIDMVEAKRILNAKELKELKWDVNEYIEKGRENAINQKWMKELENASARFHINRLEALKIRMQQSAELAFGNQLDLVDGLVRRVFTENYYHSIFEIQKGFNVGFKVAEIDDKLLNKIISKPWALDGKNFSERIWESKDKLINELHADLTQNVLLGKPPKDLINNLVKKFNTTKANASRLVMTELAFFHTVSQREAFKELDAEQYTILAVLDGKTSPVCQDFDGKVFDLKDMSIGINAPPFHPNCRSVILPYYDDDYGIGERIVSGDDGKSIYYVPANMNYKEWKESFVVPKDELVKEAVKFSRIIKYEDVEEALLSRVGFKMVEESFKRIDKQLAIDNTNQLIALEEKFGVVHESTSCICSEPDKNTIAYVSSFTSSPTFQNLSLCPEYYSNIDLHIETQLKNKSTNYSMPFLDREASVYTVTHEYGHMLQNMLIRNKMIEKGWIEANSRQFVDFTKKTKKARFKWYYAIQKLVRDEFIDEILKIARDIDNNFDIKDNISRYSKHDEAEFFAEVFANSQLGKPNVLGKAMNIWLEKKGLIK